MAPAPKDRATKAAAAAVSLRLRFREGRDFPEFSFVIATFPREG
jgi:hypothetical protein